MPIIYPGRIPPLMPSRQPPLNKDYIRHALQAAFKNGVLRPLPHQELFRDSSKSYQETFREIFDVPIDETKKNWPPDIAAEGGSGDLYEGEDE